MLPAACSGRHSHIASVPISLALQSWTGVCRRLSSSTSSRSNRSRFHIVVVLCKLVFGRKPQKLASPRGELRRLRTRCFRLAKKWPVAGFLRSWSSFYCCFLRTCTKAEAQLVLWQANVEGRDDETKTLKAATVVTGFLACASSLAAA